jgi:tetratricopeptide (TPR) repeat protein
MNKIKLWLAVLAIAITLPGCTGTATQTAQQSAPVMVLPVTTTSDEAREQFMSGVYAMDMGRFIDARGYFEKAVQIDPDFAVAYLNLAFASNSLEKFTMNLKKAEEAASGASREEQLLIEITRKGFDNDVEGSLAIAKELLKTAPKSPRACLELAGVQSGMNQHAEARQSMARAIELAPSMAAAHMQAGNSYLFSEPRDLDRAEQHMQQAAELAPNEQNPYDLLGDVYRAQGQLEKARDAYTEASKYSVDDGSPFQQRGHVNSFLGDYEAARADYDKAIAMARANQAASFGVYRAFVHVHAGHPSAAIDELKALTSKIDKMDIPEPIGLKLFALGSATNIALHHSMIDVAEALIAEWSALMRAQSEQVGTDEFSRGQKAGIAYIEGMLAVKKGEFDTAEEKADAIATLVEPDANPRKMEPVHEVRGAIALELGRYAEAAEHFQQGNHENNIYIKYHLAKALEGAGQTDQAMKLYEEVATWNFNGIGAALTRKEAMDKAKKIVG